MNKIDLITKIKTALLDLYGKNSSNLDTKYVNLDSEDTFPVLTKFPELKNIIIDLFTNQFNLFIKEIQWVAPRPTLFKIILANDQYFFLSYNTRSWISQIDGKKYYLSNIKEKENANSAISRLLKFGNQDLPQNKEEEEEITGETKPKSKSEPKPEEPE